MLNDRTPHARSQSRQYLTDATTSSSSTYETTASSSTAWSSRQYMSHRGTAGAARASVWTSATIVSGVSDDAKTAMPPDLLGEEDEEDNEEDGAGAYAGVRPPGQAAAAAARSRRGSSRSSGRDRPGARFGKLIDLGSEGEDAGTQAVQTTEAETPAEKLRALVQEMNRESEASRRRPSSPIKRVPEPKRVVSGSSSDAARVERIAAWRARRTQHRDDHRSSSSAQQYRTDHDEEDDGQPVAGPSYSSPERPGRQAGGTPGRGRNGSEPESPPTPPPRLVNPYLHTGRKISLEKQKEDRMPTRVAVLQASSSM